MRANLVGQAMMLAVAAIIQWSAMASTESSQERERSTARYLTSGPFVLDNTLDAQKREAIDAEVRLFLWENYTNRRLARVTVTRYSKEGAPTITNYFVEPDSAGRWIVNLELHRTLTDPKYPGRHFSRSVKLSAFTIERIIRQPGGVVRTLSSSDTTPPEQYLLRLGDSDGKLLQEI